jgi:hypothetical protein
LPAGEPWQDSVEVPEPPVILMAVKVQTRLVELVVTTKAMAPVNPFTGLAAIIEEAVAPTLTLMLVGAAAIVKS